MSENLSNPRLFPEAPKPVVEVNTEAIAANAPSNPYAAQEARRDAIVELRGEDLQADQIGKPVPLNTPPLVEVVRRPFEMPGQNRGRSNSEQITREKMLKGMSPQDIERQARINRSGATVARLALKDATDKSAKE
ncbi:hypothetical protein A2917_01860 [Candidatus Nomurabacteria bacterium RIFCSPLOWO2_01_FULL_42_17]|uniref:Uncharacterized protein n=1 Tax=Candidatus Nomurabacteria bacterium RIFCSPLOWO2_01_FULL_42_17 TaxID=1801780 RepID=A0A1F6XM07_9BACT|nr:MAG: hypothetical protein A2917_01860 [Candidatus Nomurabacteria bacterium RIFCSPLOWO2_01_FULL_42_17]